MPRQAASTRGLVCLWDLRNAWLRWWSAPSPTRGEGKKGASLGARTFLEFPRQHPPLKQRRIRWRREFRRPAGELLTHVGIRQNAAPPTFDLAELLALRRDRSPHRCAIVRLSPDIDACMPADPIH